MQHIVNVHRNIPYKVVVITFIIVYNADVGV